MLSTLGFLEVEVAFSGDFNVKYLWPGIDLKYVSLKKM